MLPNFVGKGTIDRRTCLQLNGKPVIEAFQALRAGLIAAANRDAAALFAEPVLTAKADQIDVAWYAEPAGEPMPIDALDADVGRIVADKLRARLESLAPLLGTDLGPLLARALYVADRTDILAIGQEPLLIRWGVLPEAVGADDQAALDRHFAETLGRYAGFGPPRIAPRPVLAGPAPTRPAQAEPNGQRGNVRPGLMTESRGLMIATLVAAVFALLFTFPGVLATPAPLPAVDDAALAHAREITKAMRDKVDQAKAALAGANCNADGSIAPPGKNAQGQLPPQPIPIKQDPSRPQGDMSLVARRATESVVFIFTCVDRQRWSDQHKDDAQKMTPFDCPNPEAASQPAPAGQTPRGDLVVDVHGSGFFIAPGLIATNTHVVEGAKAVFVTNRFLGRLSRAKVEAATVKEHAADPDFAVVSVKVERSPPPIELATSATRLQNVVAAGYPGVITEEDTQRDRLYNGDVEAVPELTTFPGFITLTMQQNKAVPLIFSSAVIGHGNSGGPLLDLCARAIGVNTLGWSGTEGDSGYKINVAEGAKALAAFLDEHGIAHKIADSACDPGLQASNGPPPGGVPPPGDLPPIGQPPAIPKGK